MKTSLRNVFIHTLSIGLCFFLLFISPTHSQKDDEKLKSSSNTILLKSDDQKIPIPHPKPKSGSYAASPKPSIDDEKMTSSDPKSKSSSNAKSPKSPIDEQKNTTLKPKSNSNFTFAKPPSQDHKDSTPDPKSKPNSNAKPPDAHKNPTHDKSKPNSNTSSPKPQTGEEKTLTPPDAKSNSNSNTTAPKPPTNAQPTPNSKPKPNPKSTPQPTKPNPKPIPSQIKPNATSPYHIANNFCLSRRLDVPNTFCLMVLRSSPNSTKAKDNLALLDIAADAAIKFGNKTLIFLKNLAKDKKTKPDLKPVIDECLSAYDGFITQYKTLVEEARVEAELPSYDAELAKMEIKRCVEALSKSKSDDIAAQNRVALDYTMLSQNIADSIE